MERPWLDGMPVTCPQCETVNEEGASFCLRCGSGLDILNSPTLGSAPTLTAHPAKPKPAPLSPATGGAGAPGGQQLESGSDFGPRYHIEGLLGRGGMGAVYKATDRELNRTVALKLVRADLTSDPSVMQRFKQELLLASRVSHRHILRIHDLGDVDGVKFISMAYVEGEDLFHLLKRSGKLPVEQAVQIAHQLGEALEAAHREGVVHRDLKPQNVLIDRTGNAFISDFGLAKSLESTDPGMTHTGQVLGTPRYMSPEQVQGVPADHRADLYALGLIFYEMLTGDNPFGGESVLQMMYKRIKEPPRDPREINPQIPAYLAKIVMRCLEQAPAGRYQTAGEFLADLDAQNATILPRPRAGTLQIPAHRAWIGMAVGIVLLLLLAAFAWRSFHRPPPPPTQATTPSGIPPLSRGKYLAVMPFHVLGNAANSSYLAEGLNEALSSKLFQLKDVHLASPDEAAKAAQLGAITKVASDLGVNLVLQGIVQSIGDRVVIIVRLHDATQNKMIWTQDFSGVQQDLFTLEDRIYSQLVQQLEVKPNNAEQARAALHPTENLAAYDLYLKGREMMRGYPHARTVQRAIVNYESAISQDASFALAYAGLADADVQMYNLTLDRIWSDKAVAAAQQAQRLNVNNLPDVSISLGNVYNDTGRTAEAIQVLQSALERVPNSDEGYRHLGAAYLLSGQKELSLKAYEKAIQINPFDWSNYNVLGNAYFRYGDYQRALDAYHRVTSMAPDQPEGFENTGAVYLQTGQYQDCLAPLQKALSLNPQPGTYSNLGTAYFYLKQYPQSIAMYQKALELSPGDAQLAGNLADAYRWAGNVPKADEAYGKAIALAIKQLAVNPRDANTMDNLALYYAKKGQYEQGAQYIAHARALNPGAVQMIYDQAMIEAMAGKNQDALKSLREAFQRGYPAKAAEDDPELKPLQSLPEFKQLVALYASKK